MNAGCLTRIRTRNQPDVYPGIIRATIYPGQQEYAHACLSAFRQAGVATSNLTSIASLIDTMEINPNVKG